ncbi:MAG: threonine aldolase family protein [Candidatus Cryptobacteroides sp.]
MVSFESDYNNGAHPSVLKHLVETNDEQSSSYGSDRFSENARRLIREATQCPQADIFFLVGGTQTNSTVISALLRPYEGVISVPSGHIAVHEAGAIEITGHKVLEIPGRKGKIVPKALEAEILKMEQDPNACHMVIPGMVYITFPTEYGTLYTAKELEAIYSICKEHNLLLYIDGARLGYGLSAAVNDISLPFLASHCDCFYIGGTKVGALCGEAVVFPRGNAPKHFFTMTKQRGALLAKSRLVGVQFEALFTDNLYFEISKHAIAMATTMKGIFVKAGLQLWNDSPTNQIFVVLDRQMIDRLKSRGILFEIWEPVDDTHKLCRFVTSWATRFEDIFLLEKGLV